MKRKFTCELSSSVGEEVRLRGWVFHYRALSKVVFLVLKDATGTVQIVASPDQIKDLKIKLDDVIEIYGKVRVEKKSKQGFEIDFLSGTILNPSSHDLPFNSATLTQDVHVGLETILTHRPLSLRSPSVDVIFKIQESILQSFRSFLKQRYFTEIITSKIVGQGTEGGSNLFEIKYFEKLAYLAQSPQFYKEHGVGGFERVFETGHVYRAEPHATVRHLTEYYSLDLEMGQIEGPEEIIELEKEMLSEMFEVINKNFSVPLLERTGKILPDMSKTPTWEFSDCIERINKMRGNKNLVDDLDPEAERQLCQLAEEQTGVPAVFVLGFPLKARPFYTHKRGNEGAAQSFDLLFKGLEITTGGQRLHVRSELENAISARGIDPKNFKEHLRMFDLGMPPHGGLAIGLERLTAQILDLPNVREATLYPRDRHRLFP